MWLLAASETALVLAGYYFLGPDLLGRASGVGLSPTMFAGATCLAIVYGLPQSYLLHRCRNKLG